MIRLRPGSGVIVLGLALLCPLTIVLRPEPAGAHCAGYPRGKAPPDRRPAGTPGTRVEGSVTPKVPRWAKPPGPETEKDRPPPAWKHWWRLNRDCLLDLRAVRHRRALAGLGDDPIAREAVLAALRAAAAHRHPDLATSAIIALGRARDAGSLPLLMGLTEETEASLPAREVAVLAVGMAGRDTKAARPFLTRILGNMDLPERLRGFAALGLGALGDAAALPALLGRAQIPGESEVVAEAALAAIGLIGDDLAVPDLARTLTRSKSWTLRGHAALALGKLGSRQALKPLTAALEDPEGHVRRQAALSIARLLEPGDEEAVGELLEMLVESADPKDRSAAAVALGEAGIAAAEDPLMHAYLGEDFDTAAHAGIGLALLARGSTDAELRGRVPDLFAGQVRDQSNVEMLALLATCLAICGDRADTQILIGAEAKVPLAAEALGIGVSPVWFSVPQDHPGPAA